MRWAGTVFLAAAVGAVPLFLRYLKDRGQDQARQIHAWCTTASSAPPEDISEVTVRCQNSSDKPVYELTIYLRSTQRTPGLSKTVSAVPPGFFIGETPVPARVEPLYDFAMNYRSVVITFRDAAGRWWKKDDHGALSTWDREIPTFAGSTAPDLRSL